MNSTRSVESDLSKLRFDNLEARLTGAVSERMLDLAGLRDGMRVLDVGSGRGEPALRAARRVGAGGKVLGIDVLDSVLEVARQKARQAGLSQLEFRAMEAEALKGIGGFEVATARWSLMYLRAPERALAAVRRVLEPNGRLVAALWAEPERVPWSTLPRRVTARYAQLPAVVPNGPGPFRYATLEQVERDFSAAGLALEHVEEADVAVVEAETGAGIVDWARVVLGRMVSAVPEAQVAAWEDELAREAEAFRSGPMIRLGGVTRLVLARPALSW